MIKNLPEMQETQVQSLSREDPLGKGMAGERKGTPVFLPGEFQEQRSLAGYSLWGHKELDMTEWLTLSFFHLTERNLASLKSKDLPST